MLLSLVLLSSVSRGDSEDDWFGMGIGGADMRIHFRCTRADLSFLWKSSSLPLFERKDTLITEMLSLRFRFCSVGPGDSVRSGVVSSRRLFVAEGKFEPQSSQVKRAASFSKVQRGQATLVDWFFGVAGPGEAGNAPFVCDCR